MANRRVTHALDVAFLVVILLPRMVRPAKFPRFTMTPRTKQQLRKFFKNHASDMADDQSRPGVGSSPSSPGQGTSGQSQAPATNAGMYLYSYSVGTPPQSVSGALDISSELVWTQCSCATCDDDVTTPPATPFYPALSTTMAELPCTSSTCQDFVAQTCSAGTPAECGYTYVYRGGEANTTGHLATKAFTFGASRVDGVVFGCGLDSTGDFGGAPGVIGLGRAPLSLVSQLQAGRFSYYFAPDYSVGSDSFIRFGDDAAPQTSRAISTPLLASSHYPNAYLVGLAGVRVDGKDLAIPRGTFDLRKDGSGGVVLSIAVPVTFLEESAYKHLRQALVSRIRLPTVNGSALGLDLLHEPVTGHGEDPGRRACLRRRRRRGAGSGELLLHGRRQRAGVPDDPAVVGRWRVAPRQPDPGRHAHGSTLAFESFEQASPPSNSSQVTSLPRRSSAPPPASSALVAHFFWFWVIMYMVL